MDSRGQGVLVEVGAVNQGTGRFAEQPSVRVAVANQSALLTPNQTRRMIHKLEEALSRCEYMRRAVGCEA
jgi:hypothetical protein